jgi:adenylylsulfate kinase-like enzyme
MGGQAGQAQTERSLTQVYWLGGSPCAGKTTIAAIIAQEHSWQVYHLDRYIDSYLQHRRLNDGMMDAHPIPT